MWTFWKFTWLDDSGHLHEATTTREYDLGSLGNAADSVNVYMRGLIKIEKAVGK